MKKLLLIFITSFLLFSGTNQVVAQEKPLVVFLVRHAEKVDSSRDPELSEAGKQRALELAETLKSAEIDFIYNTDYIRTRETAQPTAELFSKELRLYDAHNLQDFAQQLKKEKGRYLVVGHSNTTPRLVELLGGIPGEAIVEKNEYDRLYIVSINKNNEVNTILFRYGKKFVSTE